MKNWLNLMLLSIYSYSARFCGMFVVLLLFIIGLCCFLQQAKPHFEEFYSKNFIVMEPENLTKTEKVYIDKLILKNKIIPVDEVYNKTLDYYDSLISVLTIFIALITTLLGVLSFTSWFSLKGKVKNEVNEIKCGLKEDISNEIQRVVSSDFYKTWLTTEVFGKYIAENKDKLFPDASDIDIDKIVCEIEEKIRSNIEDGKRKIIIPDDMMEGN